MSAVDVHALLNRPAFASISGALRGLANTDAAAITAHVSRDGRRVITLTVSTTHTFGASVSTGLETVQAELEEGDDGDAVLDALSEAVASYLDALDVDVDVEAGDLDDEGGDVFLDKPHHITTPHVSAAVGQLLQRLLDVEALIEDIASTWAIDNRVDEAWLGKLSELYEGVQNAYHSSCQHIALAAARQLLGESAARISSAGVIDVADVIGLRWNETGWNAWTASGAGADGRGATISAALDDLTLWLGSYISDIGARRDRYIATMEQVATVWPAGAPS